MRKVDFSVGDCSNVSTFLCFTYFSYISTKKYRRKMKQSWLLTILSNPFFSSPLILIIESLVHHLHLNNNSETFIHSFEYLERKHNTTIIYAIIFLLSPNSYLHFHLLKVLTLFATEKWITCSNWKSLPSSDQNIILIDKNVFYVYSEFKYFCQSEYINLNFFKALGLLI